MFSTARFSRKQHRTSGGESQAQNATNAAAILKAADSRTTPVEKTPLRRSTFSHDAGLVAEVITNFMLQAIGTSAAMETPLMSTGLDSIAATEVAGALTQDFGVELPETLFFDHPTIGAAASFILATEMEE